MAHSATRSSLDEEKREKSAPSLSNMSKYEATESPESFLDTFEQELALSERTDDDDKYQYLPLCLGESTKWFSA